MDYKLRVSDNSPLLPYRGTIGVAVRPAAELVLSTCERLVAGTYPLEQPMPAWGYHGYDEGNRGWILWALQGKWVEPRWGKLGPNVAYALHQDDPLWLQIIVEAYLTNVILNDASVVHYELTTDGATKYPDHLTAGVFCFTPWAVGHDKTFDLHHARQATVLGRWLYWRDSVEFVRACMKAFEFNWLDRLGVVGFTGGGEVVGRYAQHLWNMDDPELRGPS